MGFISSKLRASAKGQPCMFQIPGFAKYAIDRSGNVTGPRGAIRHKLDKKGYLRVQIYDDAGKCINAPVHRLVAITHIPNPEGLPQVNHIDEDKANPSADNLEWCTASHNIRHSQAVAGSIVDPLGVVHNFSCIEDLCTEFGLTQGNIVGVLQGKVPHHKGWRTVDAVGVRFAKRIRATTTFAIYRDPGEMVLGSNIADVAAEVGLSPSGLSRLIAGKIKIHRGWSQWAL